MRRNWGHLVRTSGLILVGFAALLLVDRLWIPIQILTPHGEEEPLSPLYALWRPTLGLWHLPALGAAFLVVGATRYLPRWPPLAAALAGVVLLAVFAACLAMVRGGPSALLVPIRIYTREAYLADLPRAYEDPVRFFRQFVDLMPQLSLHGRTHPPGFILFLVGAVGLLGPLPMAYPALIITLGALAALPLHALARRRYGAEAANLAVLLYAAVPSVLLFTATSLDALLPLPTLAALDLLDRSRGRPWLALPGGILVALVTLLSFSGMAVLVVGAGLLAGGSRPVIRRVVPLLALFLAGVLLPYVLLRAILGFDMIACFARAHENLTAIEAEMKGRGLHPIRDYLYTGAGNCVAFAIGLGAPVVAGFASALAHWRHGGRREGASDGLLLGLLAALLVMDLGGAYLLEVERIWLFLIGPVVAITAADLVRHRLPRPAVAGLVALLAGQAVLQETLLYTFW